MAERATRAPLSASARTRVYARVLGGASVSKIGDTAPPESTVGWMDGCE